MGFFSSDDGESLPLSPDAELEDVELLGAAPLVAVTDPEPLMLTETLLSPLAVFAGEGVEEPLLAALRG